MRIKYAPEAVEYVPDEQYRQVPLLMAPENTI